MPNYSTVLTGAFTAKRLDVVAVCLALPITWGALSVHLGQDIAGDQLYYHYYSADALMRGRFWSDLAAGGLSGYNNPTLYFPFAGLVNHLHARAIGFWIGAYQGFNLSLVFLICYELSWTSPRSERLAFGIVAAVLAAACPIVLLETGRTLGDDWVTVPFLTGILLLLSRRSKLKPWYCGLGGLLIGVAAGLKYTNIPLAAAFGISFALARPQLRVLATVAIAMTLGILLSALWWLSLLELHFRNPLFPYYNSVFRSAFFPPLNFRDIRWQLQGYAEILTLPLRMAQGTTRVVEDTYRESHWAVFFALVSVTVVQALILRRGLGRRGLTREVLSLSVFTALAFLIWSVLFHYIRYLMIAEFTVVVSITMLLRALVASDRLALVTLAAFSAFSLSFDHYLPLNWARMPFGRHWYELPDPQLPSDSVVLLGNGIGFIEKALPVDVTIVGLGTNFFFAGLPTDGGTVTMNDTIHERAWRTPDHVYLVTLTSLPDAFRPEGVARQLGFTYEASACKPLGSNLGTIKVCHLTPTMPKGSAPAEFVATE